MRRLIPLLVIAAWRTAAAQVCAGNPTFAGSPLHLEFAMLFNTNAQSYHAGVDWGGKTAFATGTVGWTTYNSVFGGDALDFGAGFGLQAKPSPHVHLCPMVFVGYSDGPKDIGGSGVSFSEMDVSTGLQGAVVALHRKTIEIIPNAGFIVASARSKLSRPSAADSTDWDSFELLTLGIALGFNNEVTLGPSITFPFDLAGGTTTYGVSFAVRLGQGH